MFAAVVRREQPFQRLRPVGKPRQGAQGAEAPLVIGLVGAVQQKDGREGAPDELVHGQLGRGGLAVGEDILHGGEVAGYGAGLGGEGLGEVDNHKTPILPISPINPIQPIINNREAVHPAAMRDDVVLHLTS